MKRNKGHLGITLMETIVVVAVIVILSAVSVWGVFSFIEAGRQTNRMNIARTLYLAAQNQLTQLRVTGGLDDFVERANPDGEERRVIEQFNNPVVGWNDPEEIRDYVHFISRAAGTPAYEDCPVMELLGSVLVYNEITNDAVLIEFNIRTGVVLSAFYGDRFVSGHFVYNDDSPNGAFAGIGTAVRGAGYESIARGRNRRQGFYGVSVTGQVAEGINPLSVTIIDNHTGFAPLEGTVNKLFARAIIPPQYSLDMFTLTLEQNGAAIGSVSFDLSSYDWESDKLYTEYVTADGESLIVWILDLVEGDTTEINYISEHSISTLGIAPDAFIRAMIDNDTRGSHAVSFAAHPYFGVGSANNQFVISSARHLFNIRFAQSGEFVQWDNIYLNLAGSVVTNFEPIPDFFGDFCGNGFNISSLSIDNFIRNEDDIGLFARTSFDSNVRNLTLVDPRIICSYRNNAGAVAGVLQGNISNVHVFGNEMISAASNVGGIVGTVSGGELRDSAFVSTRRVALVSGNSAGGIVGFYEGGSISRLLLLAKAPIDTEDIIAPIVGSYNERPNDDNLIYLYGIGIRPTMAEYNTLPANLGSPRDTLAIRDLHLSLPWPTPPDMADEDAISLENTRYPYPIFGPRNFSGDWGWPITVGGSLQIFYFERYDNHTTGFFSFEGRVDTLVNDRRILRAGYVAIVETQAPLTDSFRRSRLQLLVGNELEPIDINLINIVGTDFENYFGNNDTYFYIFRLPPDEFPDVATSPLRIRYGAADIPEARRDEAMREHVDDEEFYLHPYFAHAIYDSGNALDTFMVRTPWQMGNISYMPQDNNLTYVQTRNINFFLDGYGPVNCPETWLNLDIRTAVVTTPFRGTYEGNYHSLTLNRAALFNQTEPNSRVRNFSLTNTIINRPDDTGSAGAIANTANGFVYNIDVQNPFVLVGGSAGGAIGTLGGEAFRINVRYNSNQEIYGSLHAGGIVGDIQGGHLRDSVFMSTRPQSHVMGSGTLGGLVGVNNGSMTRLALLALAPETGEHLFPIEGGGAGGTDVFFLQGTPIRPSSAEVGGAYNIGDFHSGTALSTFRTAMGTTPGFREANALTAQWKVLHLEEEEYAIRLDNEIFPYPFFIPTDTDVDEWPWPIVLSFSYFHGNVFYFERYANRYGLFPLRPAMPAGMGMLNNTSVLEAGYMVVVSDEEYEEISAFDVPVLRVEVGHELWHDISLDHFVPNSPAVGWRSHRLCNDELADLLTQRHGVNNYRPLRIVMGADEDNEYSFIHPLFAQAVFSMDSGLGSTVNPFTVRTPWQMQNINQMPNNASNLYFRQGRNMDIAADGAGNTGNGAGADITGTSVVTVNFAGAYNGDFFTISSTPRALFGTNSGVVQGIIMRDSNISGGVNVGSIANINNGVIRRIGVENTTIGGTNNVGGIVGNNTNIVEDVYFLSTASHDEQPVYGTATGASRAIGGIVGNNTGTVTRAIYLAPAPSVREDTNVNLYPIIGRGDEAVPDTTFFLMGHVYTPDAEHRYIEDVAPDDTIDIPYNFRSPGETLTIHNGGIGMRAGQLHFGNINSDFDNILLGTWTMEDPYPYPVLIGMRGIPRAWPMANSPPQPDQLNRELITPGPRTSDRARSPGFGNGSFADNFRATIPLSHATGHPRIPSYQHINNGWFSIDMDMVEDWHTRPAPTHRNLFNTTDPDFWFPRPASPGFAADPTLTPIHRVERWRIIEFQEPNAQDDFMRTNYRGENRARNAITATQNVRNSLFRYAELNAESPGTLYQVTSTTPGMQFYYSFFHATNGFPGFNPGDWYTPPTTAGDRLNFFLSYVDVGQSPVVTTLPHAVSRDNAMVMVRPAQSPRSAPIGIGALANTANMGINAPAGLILNPSAWNTVAYGPENQSAPTTNNSGGSFDIRTLHQGQESLQADGTLRVQNIPSETVFLYDIWIDTGRATIATSTINATGNVTANANIIGGRGGTRTGFGVTFWSTNPNLTVTNAAGTDTVIPLNGITSGQLTGGTWPWLNDVRNNVIGFWDVSYGWKRFYGLYTVPEGQGQTEFSFQSSTGPSRITVGNYLDGVTFRTPAFLSIDKSVFDSESGEETRFVRPGQRMTVETYVINWGEIPANRLVLRGYFEEYSEYIKFVSGSVNVAMVNPAGARTTITPQSVNMVNGVLEIQLPAAQTLADENMLVVSYDIDVRPLLDSVPRDTLLYHFHKQTEIEFRESGDLTAFQMVEHRSASSPVQIFIDPIRLETSVERVTDRLFDVRLHVVDAIYDYHGVSDVTTRGVIIVTLPDGFSVVNAENNLPPGAISQGLDGLTHIIIGGVTIGGNIRRQEFYYRLIYEGSDFGVSYINLSADYRYTFEGIGGDEELFAMLRFMPVPVVGIRPAPSDVSFEVNVGQVAMLDFLDGVISNERRLADDNYEVTPVVILLDENRNPVTNTVDGDHYIQNTNFTAILRAATDHAHTRLEFTPTATASGSSFRIYYRIELIATRPGSESFDLSTEYVTITVNVP